MHAKKHDSQKARLKEERSEYLEGNHGPDCRPGKLCKPCKAQTKLKRENDTSYDPNPEAHCEDAQPKAIDLQIQRILGPEPETFYDSKEHGKPDGHRREDDVKADGECELNAG
jgi:hypothetical protein